MTTDDDTMLDDGRDRGETPLGVDDGDVRRPPPDAARTHPRPDTGASSDPGAGREDDSPRRQPASTASI